MRQKLLLDPVDTKEELDQFLQYFLDVKLTDNKVDPESTCSQLEAIWRIYYAMRYNKGPKNFVCCTSRNGGKTLMASLIALLGNLHFRRNTVLMAAILGQSQQAIKYIDNHSRKIPELKDFYKSDSQRLKMFIDLPPNSYTRINDNATTIVVPATLTGANAQRGQIIILDEVDQVPQEVISEVAGVADPTRDEHGWDPITIGLSSRKTPDGPLQDRIDMHFKDPDLWQLLKWSSIDMMDQCMFKDKINPKKYQNVVINENTLEMKWGNTLEDIDPAVRDEWKQRQAYSKCKTCSNGRGFLFCQGLTLNSIPKDSPLRRNMSYYIGMAGNITDSNVFASQHLNWKPSTKGVVYRRFAEHTHTGDIKKAWEWTMGVELPSEVKNITDFVKILSKFGWTFIVGLDYGYNNAASIVAGFDNKKEKYLAFLPRMESGWADQAWSRECIRYYERELRLPISLYAPDVFSPAVRSYFVDRPHTPQKPTKVATGVSQLRGLLFDPRQQQHNILFIKDGSGEHWDKLIHEIKHWKHKYNATTGEWNLEDFEKQNDHLLDSLRYALAPSIKTSTGISIITDSYENEKINLNKNYEYDLVQLINEEAGYNVIKNEESDDDNGIFTF